MITVCPLRVAAHTLGCKVNQYETQAMLSMLADKGFYIVPFDTQADVYIINTCTVTNVGDKKSRQMIRKAHKQNPNALIVACGCYTQANPDAAAQISGVSIVLGTSDRSKVAELVERRLGQNSRRASLVRDISREREYESISLGDRPMLNHERVFIKIQDGCDRFCSYCVVPLTRGPVRSRRPEQVLEEAKTMAAHGCKEIVLTGIHVASYGKDLIDTSVDLPSLLRRVHEIKGVQRLRFSSIDPTVLTQNFLRALTEMPKVCDHFHLSLQSGCDATLKRMNRRYTTSEYRSTVKKIRLTFPNAALTTDMIVGFPGETDQEFTKSFLFAEEMQFAKIHVFPYSPKKGTAAYDFPNPIPEAIKTARARRLSGLSGQMRNAFMQRMIGLTLPVLFEKKVAYNLYEGLTTNYVRVRAAADTNILNQICDAHIRSMAEQWLYGDRIMQTEEGFPMA